MRWLVVLVLACVPARSFADPLATDVVDKWLHAQNAGKFADYERLYAKRFHGIRRSGDKTVRLDRAGWMKERKKMFEHPMVVEARDIVVESIGPRTRVHLTQLFTQGKYQDAGPKELVVVGDRIVSEEMLASTLAGADGSICDELRCKGTSAPAAIVATCEKACAAGTASSCREAAMIYETAACHVARDGDKARRFYASACGPDDAMSCTAAVTDEPLPTAEALLAKACEYGDPYGCYRLAHLLIDAHGDGRRAVGLLEKACDEFDRSGPGGMACSELVAIYREGKLVKKDKAKVAEYELKYKNSQEGE
jgi:hypothetical protein